MAYNRKLETDADFREAMERQVPIRIFRDDHVVGAGGIISRFTESEIIIQSGVGDLAYFRRDECEFFGMKKR